MSKWLVKDKAGDTYEVVAEDWDSVGVGDLNELRFFDGKGVPVAMFIEPICWMQQSEAQ